MKLTKIFFSISMIFLFNIFSISASQHCDQEDIDRIQTILSPHIEFYKRKELLKDISTSSGQLEVAKFLYSEVYNDKDYLAAQVLQILEEKNTSVAKFLNEKTDAKVYINKALTLGNLMNQEFEAIQLSVSNTKAILNDSQDPNLKKLAIWLACPLPCDRIKCLTVDILSLRKSNSEVNEIIEALSITSFGRQQVEKAKSKLPK